MIPVGIAVAIVLFVMFANLLVQINIMAHSLSQVAGQLSELHEMNLKLNLLSDVDEKLTKTNSSLGLVEARINSMNSQLGLLGTMATELGGLSGALGHMSGKLDATYTALSQTNQKLGALSTLSTLSDLDRKLDTLAGLDLELKQTNAGIAGMQKTLGSVSDALGGMQTQLGVLTPMNESLKSMSEQIGRSFIGHRPRLFGG